MKLLTDAEIERLRGRRMQGEFAAAAGALEKCARDTMAAKIDIPRRGAGWSHDYFCTEHAALLVYDPALPRTHRCPADGKIFTGEKYDDVWIYFTQSRVVKGLHAAALMWVMTGERAYADHACAVLLAYAERYPNYPVHGAHAGRGRCMGQSLCEGVWGIPLAWGYDCVRETLSVGERATIESQLLRPLAEHMNSQMWETVHNIQCWHMAALATVGRVLGDDAWIRRSIEGAWGLERQLIEGVLADGWWWEGSPGYHFYTMEALLHLLVALRGVRPEVLGHPKFQAMLRAPLEMARSDGSLPALNDGWFVMTKPWSLVSYAPRYEMACGLWDQAEQRERLGQLYGPACVRDSIEALVFGPETCACEAVPKPTCLQEASGYAVLRHGPVDAERWLMLKFGPQGGYHGHFDKLGLDLHAFGKPLSSDLGTPGYGIPLNASWYRHTLSHNAVLLDGRPQPEGAGKIEKFAIDAAGLSVAHASVTFPGSVAAPYAGTRMDRAILWRDGTHPYFIDVVRVRRPSSGLIDLAWHHLGELDLPGLEPLAWIGQNATYSLLTQVQAMTAGSYHATWRGAPADPVTQCFGLNPPGTQIVAARVPYNPASETMSLLLRRSTAQEAWFVGVFEIVPPGAVAQLKKVDWAASPASGGPISFMVQGDRWVEGWTVAGGSQGEGRGKALASPATGQFVYELSE